MKEVKCDTHGIIRLKETTKRVVHIDGTVDLHVLSEDNRTYILKNVVFKESSPESREVVSFRYVDGPKDSSQ